MSLTMLWYQLFEGKIISKQQRLKTYIFTIKIMTNRNQKYIIIFKKIKIFTIFSSVVITKNNFQLFYKNQLIFQFLQDILK